MPENSYSSGVFMCVVKSPLVFLSLSLIPVGPWSYEFVCMIRFSLWVLLVGYEWIVQVVFTTLGLAELDSVLCILLLAGWYRSSALWSTYIVPEVSSCVRNLHFKLRYISTKCFLSVFTVSVQLEEGDWFIYIYIRD